MRRYRATVDIYVDVEDMEEYEEEMSDEELCELAKSNVHLFMDCTNFHYEASESNISFSDIIQDEIYDTEEEDDYLE